LTRSLRVRTSILALSLLILVGSALPANAASGALDRSFGGDGLVLSTGLFGDFRATPHAVALQRDGKIVLVGERIRDWSPSTARFAIARYTREGRVDRTFGQGGTVVSGRPAGPARDVAIQPDGRIVVVGGVDELVVRRYLPNGRPDPEFNLARAVDRPASASAVLIQPDRKILVAGGVLDAGGAAPDALIVRYRPDGSLDESFGDRGVVITGVPEIHDWVEDLALLPGGDIVAVGWSANWTLTVGRMLVARLSPSGALDSTLNPVESWGRQASAFGSFEVANAVAVRRDGQILLAGWGYYEHSPPRGNRTENVVLVQYLPDGSLDPAFGDGGTAIISTSDSWHHDEAGDLALQPDGKAVVTGMTGSPHRPRGLLMRVLPDGSLDPSFGTGGLVKSRLPGDAYAKTVWTGVALQPDGRIVTSGWWCFSEGKRLAKSRCRFAAARFRG
jgi:uncharacterized delta-60 repeat protein